MKKLLVCLMLVFLPVFAFSQGQFLKGARAVKNAKSATGAKCIKIPAKVSKPVRLAGSAAKAKSIAADFSVAAPAFVPDARASAQVTEFLERTINLRKAETQIAALNYKKALVPMLADPKEATGSYADLKKVARIAKNDKQILKIQPKWNGIWKSQGYNGAHHIMNKYAIKQIWEGTPLAGRIDFDMVVNDAPAMFHPGHGNPSFAHIFHNPETQISLYRSGGVKAVMEHQLFYINQLNIDYGFPQLSEVFMQNTMKQARQWSATYKLKWK